MGGRKPRGTKQAPRARDPRTGAQSTTAPPEREPENRGAGGPRLVAPGDGRAVEPDARAGGVPAQERVAPGPRGVRLRLVAREGAALGVEDAQRRGALDGEVFGPLDGDVVQEAVAAALLDVVDALLGAEAVRGDLDDLRAAVLVAQRGLEQRARGAVGVAERLLAVVVGDGLVLRRGGCAVGRRPPCGRSFRGCASAGRAGCRAAARARNRGA